MPPVIPRKLLAVASAAGVIAFLGLVIYAITASAHKLARLVYFMLTKGQAFVEAGQDEYEERYRQRVVQNLAKRAREMGFELKPKELRPA